MSAPAAVRRAEPVCRRHLDKEARALMMGRASLAHDEFGPDRLPPSLILKHPRHPISNVQNRPPAQGMLLTRIKGGKAVSFSTIEIRALFFDRQKLIE
jgi:hypothetical protein